MPYPWCRESSIFHQKMWGVRVRRCDTCSPDRWSSAVELAGGMMLDDQRVPCPQVPFDASSSRPVRRVDVCVFFFIDHATVV